MNKIICLIWKRTIWTAAALAVFVLPCVAFAASDGAAGTSAPGNALEPKSREAVAPETALPAVSVPDAIYPGQAFLVRVCGKGLESVSFIWLAKTLTVPARVDGAEGVSEILLPVPYEEKTGRTAILRMRVMANGAIMNMKRTIPIRYKKYPEQSLSVDSRFVKLNKKDLERSKRERAETLTVLNAFTPERFWSLPFQRSVPGTLRSGVSSHFGLRRVFNGEPRSHHRGLDLRASQGTPIRACADGTVVIAADHFFSGNVVYIDHGQGVVTMYAHMSRIAAEPGQKVKAGEIIGYVGSTGRVTGPHLHLGLSVQGISVDVLPFLEKDKPASSRTKQRGASVNAGSGQNRPVASGASVSATGTDIAHPAASEPARSAPGGN